jgi:hypothetical protein
MAQSNFTPAEFWLNMPLDELARWIDAAAEKKGVK